MIFIPSPCLQTFSKAIGGAKLLLEAFCVLQPLAPGMGMDVSGEIWAVSAVYKLCWTVEADVEIQG